MSEKPMTPFDRAVAESADEMRRGLAKAQQEAEFAEVLARYAVARREADVLAERDAKRFLADLKKPRPKATRTILGPNVKFFLVALFLCWFLGSLVTLPLSFEGSPSHWLVWILVWLSTTGTALLGFVLGRDTK
jgi:hypothetical protein